MASLGIQCVGEMVGTLLLILLGNGVNFSVSHRKMFANQPGKWVLIVIGWAIGVFLGAIVAIAIGSEGHINPVVSVFVSLQKEDPQFLAYIPMQLLGAFLGQILLYLMNWHFIKLEALDSEGDKYVTRGSSCTSPAFPSKRAILNNGLYEFVGTSILLIIILFITDSKFNVSLGPDSQKLPINIFIISSAILSIGISIGSATGFALNPARDLSPRLAYQLLRFTKVGKNLATADWSYSWIPVVFPLLSGLLFGLITLGW